MVTVITTLSAWDGPLLVTVGRTVALPPAWGGLGAIDCVSTRLAVDEIGTLAVRSSLPGAGSGRLELARACAVRLPAAPAARRTEARTLNRTPCPAFPALQTMEAPPEQEMAGFVAVMVALTLLLKFTTARAPGATLAGPRLTNSRVRSIVPPAATAPPPKSSERTTMSAASCCAATGGAATTNAVNSSPMAAAARVRPLRMLSLSPAAPNLLRRRRRSPGAPDRDAASSAAPLGRARTGQMPHAGRSAWRQAGTPRCVAHPRVDLRRRRGGRVAWSKVSSGCSGAS